MMNNAIRNAARLAAVSFFLCAPIASAGTQWTPSQGQSCGTVCSAQDMAAVSSGVYEGENFYVCSGKFQNDADNRPGFNLIQGWSPKGELCFAAYGKQTVSVSAYNCLCDTAASSPAVSPEPKAKKPQSTGDYNFNGIETPESITKKGQDWVVNFSVTLMKAGDDPALATSGGANAPYTILAGSIELFIDDVLKSSSGLDEVGTTSFNDIKVSGGEHAAYMVYKDTNGTVVDASETTTFDAK